MLFINKRMWMLAIPAALSCATVLKCSVWLLSLWVVAHFIIIGVVPTCKGRETVWMFTVVAFSSVPINIYILLLMNKLGVLFGSMPILGVLRCILYYAVLLSVEEIVMGVVTRLIWRKQYKVEL